MLKITSDGRKLGLDQRIINPNLPDEPTSEAELRTKSARLAELNIELNIDDKTPLETLAEEAPPRAEIAKSASLPSLLWLNLRLNLRQAKERAAIFAKYESPILLYGETGTGKELFAQSIHNGSSRKGQPFVAINCAALSESLIESELFGYVKGAFTGANKEGKQGLFELANKGTIFLDEISELPISIQSKLLRAIQEGEIIRVGGDKIIRVDTRVICSSNKDILHLIQENKFKVDLYYRLCVLEVDIPPLRERPEDIPILATRFVQSRAKKHQKDIRSIHPRVLEELSQMQFMGNIRELISIAERLVILETTPEISVETLHRCIPVNRSAPALPKSPEFPEFSAELMNFKDAPKQMILHALEQCGWNKAAATRMLKIDASTLYRKMKAYQIPSHRE